MISLGGHAAFYTGGDALIDIHDHTLCHIYSDWLLRVQIRIPSGKTVRHKSRGMNYEITYANRIVLFICSIMLWNLFSRYDTTIITSILFLLARRFEVNSSEMPFSSQIQGMAHGHAHAEFIGNAFQLTDTRDSSK